MLPDLAREARSAGFGSIEIYTNGLALSDARVRSRRTGACPAVIDALAAIARVVKRGLEARVSIVLMEANGQHLEATTAYLVALGVPADRIGSDRVRGVDRGALALHDLRRAQPPVPTVEARGNHSGAGNTSETPRWPGKLCVAYTGAVYPCIFSRRNELGHVARESLPAILDRVRDRRGTGVDVDAGRDQLACFDCRLTALALGGAVPA